MSMQEPEKRRGGARPGAGRPRLTAEEKARRQRERDASRGIGPTGPSRGFIRYVDDQSTRMPAPAGLASDQFGWVLRGLYQQQWDDILEFRYYPREPRETDWAKSQRDQMTYYRQRARTGPHQPLGFKFSARRRRAEWAKLNQHWWVHALAYPAPPPRRKRPSEEKA